jgi:ABC-2 type transport system ATP-binding protein
MNYAIEFDDVTWRAGNDFALENFSLRVPRGSIYGFLGPNGAGKSTTIRLLMGMMKPHGGSIRMLDGRVPRDLHEVLQKVGYVPERPHLFSQLSVKEAIDYHASFYRSWDALWATELLERLDLRPDQRIKRLSKGQTGKLMMLLALAVRPQLLILDEPTDGLDPVVRRDIMTTVLDYVGETGATIFISSHLVHELERICDWVGVVDNGELLTELPMNEFKNGIKRLRLENAPDTAFDLAPFALLDRIPANGTLSFETWVVHGWEDPHRGVLEDHGVMIREVVDLDLEEGFVELLRATRAQRSREDG